MTTNLAQVEPTRQAEACKSRLECLRDRKGIYGIGMVGGKEERHIILRPDKVQESGQITQYGHVAFQQIVPSGPLRRTAEFYLAQILQEKMLERAGLSRHEEDLPEHWWSQDKKEQDANRRKFYAYRKNAITITNALIRQALAEVPAQMLRVVRRYPIRYRQCIYEAIAREGVRVLQLAETFPALALIIFGPVGTSEHLQNKKKQAASMVRHGVELKHIAGFFDLPMILKRFGPLTARDALRVDSIVGLLHNHMPASERQKRLWLRAIWIGANRVELPDDAVPPFIRWIARNALNLGKTLDEVLSPLVDIKDWVAASYKSPRNPNWAYFKSTAKSDTLGERCVVTRPFDEHMSLSTVLNLSEEWHHAVAEADLEGENCAFPTPWYAASKMGNFEIVPLEQKAELYLEGKTMHHCVTTYSEQVQAGDCYFYSVRKGDKKIATVELNAPNHNVQLAQLRGPCNQKVSKDVDKAVHRWFAQCKRKHGNGNYMSRLRLVTTRNVLDADDIPF